MTPDLPFWFKQRQLKAEETATGTFKVTGPNAPEAVIGVRMTDDLHWQAFVRKADGTELAASAPTLPNAREALGAAFELYRETVVV